jgi:hypothetical protein
MQVAKKKTGKEVWDCLKVRFVGADRVKDARLQTLKVEYEALKMKEDEPLDQYAGKLTAMSVKFGDLGGTLEDSYLVKKLFDTVPERFINVIAGIEQFYDLKTLAFEGDWEVEGVRRKSSVGGWRFGCKTDSSGQLLLTQAEWESRQKKAGGESSGRGVRSSDGGSRGGGRSRGRGRGRGGRGEAPGRSDGAARKGKEHIKCFNCKEYGHYANRCPQERKGGGEEAHHAQVEKFEPALMLTVAEELLLFMQMPKPQQQAVILQEERVFPELHLTGGGTSTGNIWYLDNGASNHIVGAECGPDTNQ